MRPVISHVWLFPIVLIAIAVCTQFPYWGLACFIAPLFVWKFAPQLLGDEKGDEKRLQLQLKARRISVRARLHLDGWFVTVESFTNAEERVALPTILYVERQYENVLSYFAGRKLIWKDYGREGAVLEDPETHERAPAVELWEPVVCEILVDDASKKVLAISTPEGLMPVTGTSKNIY